MTSLVMRSCDLAVGWLRSWAKLSAPKATTTASHVETFLFILILLLLVNRRTRNRAFQRHNNTSALPVFADPTSFVAQMNSISMDDSKGRRVVQNLSRT